MYRKSIKQILSPIPHKNSHQTKKKQDFQSMKNLLLGLWNPVPVGALPQWHSRSQVDAKARGLFGASASGSPSSREGDPELTGTHTFIPSSQGSMSCHKLIGWFIWHAEGELDTRTGGWPFVVWPSCLLGFFFFFFFFREQLVLAPRSGTSGDFISCSCLSFF